MSIRFFMWILYFIVGFVLFFSVVYLIEAAATAELDMTQWPLLYENSDGYQVGRAFLMIGLIIASIIFAAYKDSNANQY